LRRRVWREALLIVLFGIIFGLLSNAFREDRLPVKRERKSLLIDIDKFLRGEFSFKSPPRINLEQAFELFLRGALFIDSRGREKYEQAHIKGAVNFPLEEFNELIDSILSIPVDTPIVAYCDGSGCNSSSILGEKLMELGFEKVLVFEGGWKDWLEAGYPTE